MRRMHDEFPNTEVIVITGCAHGRERRRIGSHRHLRLPREAVRRGQGGRCAQARDLAPARALGLVSFLEELGSVVGRDQDAAAILHEVERSQKMRGRLAALLGERSDEEWRAPRPTRCARSTSSRCSPRRSRPRTATCAATPAASRSTPACSPSASVCSGATRSRCGSPRSCTTSARSASRPTCCCAQAALDPHERRIVEQHPVIGARLVRPLLLQSDLTLAIRHHHEWWDGTGYPDGLSGSRSRSPRASSRSSTRSTR